MSDDKKGSELGLAAAGLEAELQRFDDLSELARKIKLSSEKNVDKSARALADAAASQEKIAGLLGALVQAIANARSRQESNAGALLTRAEEIRERRAKLSQLQERFAALGEEAKAINGLVQEISAAKKGFAKTGELVDRLALVEARMAGVIDGATALLRLAEEDGLEDVARQADSLRQQIHGARNKIRLLQQSLSVA